VTRFGIAALICYAIHGGFHLLHHRPGDLLWACHIGAAIVGVGLLTLSPVVNGIGVLLLCMGTPLWLMDLAGGGEFFPTSVFTHLGGLAIGLYGVRRLGMPRGVWWKTTVALIALIFVCRLATPERANVNVAFAIQPGWETYFPSHRVYLVVIISEAAAYFFIVELVLRRWLARRGKEGDRCVPRT
jgi:hypothetical protein